MINIELKNQSKRAKPIGQSSSLRNKSKTVNKAARLANTLANKEIRLESRKIKSIYATEEHYCNIDKG